MRNWSALRDLESEKLFAVSRGERLFFLSIRL